MNGENAVVQDHLGSIPFPVTKMEDMTSNGVSEDVEAMQNNEIQNLLEDVDPIFLKRPPTPVEVICNTNRMSIYGPKFKYGPNELRIQRLQWQAKQEKDKRDKDEADAFMDKRIEEMYTMELRNQRKLSMVDKPLSHWGEQPKEEKKEKKQRKKSSRKGKRKKTEEDELQAESLNHLWTFERLQVTEYPELIAPPFFQQIGNFDPGMALLNGTQPKTPEEEAHFKLYLQQFDEFEKQQRIQKVKNYHTRQWQKSISFDHQVGPKRKFGIDHSQQQFGMGFGYEGQMNSMGYPQPFDLNGNQNGYNFNHPAPVFGAVEPNAYGVDAQPNVYANNGGQNGGFVHNNFPEDQFPGWDHVGYPQPQGHNFNQGHPPPPY